MKIVTIIGARPQFVKAAAISKLLRRDCQEILVHTGQHYDSQMSEVFFNELEIPAPEVNLNIGSGRHGAQTGQMLEKIEDVLVQEKPSKVLVYGDTNSTLAGALAAAKLHIPVIHVEAGLRSFDKRMPEEINRILTDSLSAYLLCPSQVAVDNLKAEGRTAGVYLVGDVMQDVFYMALETAQRKSGIFKKLSLREKKYLLATVHRAENTDSLANLKRIIAAFSKVEDTIVFPVHPRTRKIINDQDCFAVSRNVKLIEPVGYLDMARLIQGSRIILTDSGGLQKEAYWAGVPCITLRNNTEWVETVENGWNILTGTDTLKIVNGIKNYEPPASQPKIYGDKDVVSRCLDIIVNH